MATSNNWRLVAQHLPLAGKLVLVVFADATKAILAHQEGRWFDQHSVWHSGPEPIYWHPLPPPPDLPQHGDPR